jgi:hypothetical protein
MIHDPDLLDRLDALPKETFDGEDGLIAPCARWSCDNLILFPDRMGVDANLEIVQSEAVDWVTWATAHGLIA